MTVPLLEARKISKSFGGVQALKDVAITVNPGDIYGLIGPNGAGKTTLFNILTGLYYRDRGYVIFLTVGLPDGGPHEITRRGMARTFQNIRLFGAMTALENVLVGSHLKGRCGLFSAIFRTPAFRREEAELRARAHALLAYVGIAEKAHHLANSLSYGDQRRLEIARALASQPRLLALDEPAAGMNATETAQLAELIQRIRADGTTVLLIEHDVKLIMNLCDRVGVLDHGEMIIEDVPDVVRKDPRVIEAYLGVGHAH